MTDHVEPAPDAQIVWRFQHAGDVGTEADDLVNAPAQAVGVQKAPVAIEYRHQGQRGDAPGGGQSRERPPLQRLPNEPGHPQSDEHRQVNEVVPARQGLQHPGDCKQRQPAAAMVVEVPVKSRQRNRHPVGRQHLQVRELRHAIRGECERQPGKERTVVTPRNRVSEKVRGQSDGRMRERMRCCTRARAAARQDDRCRDYRQAEQMLGERRRPVHGVELRTIPPAGGQWHDPRIPRENPVFRSGSPRSFGTRLPGWSTRGQVSATVRRT